MAHNDLSLLSDSYGEYHMPSTQLPLSLQHLFLLSLKSLKYCVMHPFYLCPLTRTTIAALLKWHFWNDFHNQGLLRGKTCTSHRDVKWELNVQCKWVRNTGFPPQFLWRWKAGNVLVYLSWCIRTYCAIIFICVLHVLFLLSCLRAKHGGSYL